MINRAQLLPHELQKRQQALLDAWARQARPVVVQRASIVVDGAEKVVDGRSCHDGVVRSVPAAFCPGVVTVVSYAEAWRWAAENGLLVRRQPLNLTLVNMIRKQRGEPPFALKGAA